MNYAKMAAAIRAERRATWEGLGRPTLFTKTVYKGVVIRRQLWSDFNKEVRDQMVREFIRERIVGYGRHTATIHQVW